MYNKINVNYLEIFLLSLYFTACVPSLPSKTDNLQTPVSYNTSSDTVNTGKVKWKQFFTDPNLISLIDTALKNNQELNIISQEILVARNEVKARRGEYLPSANVGAGASTEKVGRNTRFGALENNPANQIEPGKSFPEQLPNFMVSAKISWEVDIWRKLRNAKKAAMYRYMATAEGKNFMITSLVAKIANAYFELMALDNQMLFLKKNIEIQTNAFEIVKQQKAAARVTELAVRKFEAEVFKNQSRQYDIAQRIVETENRINFLVGRYPQAISRNSKPFIDLVPDSILNGIPLQLLENRPDVRQAELELQAAKLDVKAAKANFYPSLRLNAGTGFEAYKPQLLLNPESLLYYLGGELSAPLLNRNSIKAYYSSANARQIQKLYNYEKTLLGAFIEVANQSSNISNLANSYSLKEKQVEALSESITISNNLFRSVRADYMEVLMTQRDALDSRFELIDIKKQQFNAMVDMYQALGGGWK